MRILQLIDSLKAGGKERQFVELVRGLSSHPDCDLELAVMNRSIHYEEIHDTGLTINFLIRKIKKDPAIFYAIYRICKRTRPDIIHTWDTMTTTYALPIARLLNVRVVNGSIRNATPTKMESVLGVYRRFLFNQSDIVVSNTYAGLKASKVSSRNSVCIHNGFDYSRINDLESREQVRERYGIRAGKVVGMVASLSGKKDIDTYMKAAELVLAQRSDVTLLFIGGGNEEMERKLVGFQAANQRFLYLGQQHLVESIINTFNVGVLTTDSSVHMEGIPNVVMEYMALRKPVVATRGPGIEELVVDGDSGFLVDAKSPAQLAQKISHLLDHDDLARRMGEVGGNRIQTEFSLVSMVTAYYSLYRRMLGSGMSS